MELGEFSLFFRESGVPRSCLLSLLEPSLIGYQVAQNHSGKRLRITVLSRAPGLKTGRCLKIRAGHLSRPLLTVFAFGIHKIDVK